MTPYTVDAAACREWSRASALEWLETNGTGGFAMGTVSGANTRRYHGILVASLRPPVERTVLLSRVEEEVVTAGGTANLGAVQYPGVVTPDGYRRMDQFRLDPFPTWTYRVGDVEIEKRLFLRQGEQTAVVQYRASQGCRMRLRVFCAFRDYHWLRKHQPHWQEAQPAGDGVLVIEPYSGAPRLRLHHNAGAWVPEACWYYNNEYPAEAARGMECHEDLFSPGWFDFECRAGKMAYLVATLAGHPPLSADTIAGWEREERMRREPDEHRLEAAARQFLVRRQDGTPTIIAGYPWFTDWGRDTMISLPGLLIARGCHGEAREILEGFLRHLNQGLIPNRFPDAGEKPEYNTADATLWMFQAVWAFQSGDEGFVRDRFYAAAKEILAWHRRGTHFQIRADPADGLLSAGGPGTQLTWMDAKVGDWVVTPRHGKPVEINALWYNALRMTAHWARLYGEPEVAASLDTEAALVQASFRAAFWNGEYLNDRIAPEGPDQRIRPNQLFALSLPFGLLEHAEAASVLEVVERKLLTPVGLRTLDPADPEYRPRYEGGPYERDGAYHQGTVWPWLMGPYISARLKAFGAGPANAAHCRRLVEGMAVMLEQGCLGSIGEIYDGEEPRKAKGAPAQAWSVAELLRVIEELKALPLKY